MPKKKELWSTFRGNNPFPIYNWFYFTEAYSRGLVRNLLLKYNQKKEALIVDPFCGTGTTLLVSKEFGFNAIGLDVSPLMVLISKVKSANYDFGDFDFENFLSKAKEQEVELDGKAKWIKKYFYRENLDDLLKIKAALDYCKNEREKLFYAGVLLKTLQIVTKAEKHGACLKIRKIPKLDVFETFEKTFRRFKKDWEKMAKKFEFWRKVEPKVYNENVAHIKKHVQECDFIVTSPPYPNKIEYVRRFGIELAFFGYDSILKEHLGTKVEKRYDSYIFYNFFKLQKNLKYKLNLGDYNLENYFIGLENFVHDAYDILRYEGVLSITIAGACFPTFALDIFEYMNELYRRIGFKVENVKVERTLVCHKDRTTKIGKIREFTIVGRK